MTITEVQKLTKVDSIKTTPELAYDVVSQNYDSSYTRLEDINEDRELLRDLIAKNMFNDEIAYSTLDLGCGTGYLLDLLKENEINAYNRVMKAKRYIGIDISHNMLKKAKNKHKSYVFAKYDFDTLWLPEFKQYWIDRQKFQRIISTFGSVSYSTNIINLAKGVEDVLAKDGLIYLMFYQLPKYYSREHYILNRSGLSIELMPINKPLLEWAFRAMDNIKVCEFNKWWWVVTNG